MNNQAGQKPKRELLPPNFVAFLAGVVLALAVGMIFRKMIDRMEPLNGGAEEKDRAIKHMRSTQQLSTSSRTLKGLKRALEFVTPESMKEARCIRSYPSDPV